MIKSKTSNEMILVKMFQLIIKNNKTEIQEDKCLRNFLKKVFFIILGKIKGLQDKLCIQI